jgi:hypothetical protein
MDAQFRRASAMIHRLAAIATCCFIAGCAEAQATANTSPPAADTIVRLTYRDTVTIDFDTLRAAMTRLEQQLAGGAAESEMPKLLLRLGMMKLAHEPHFEDTAGLAYVKARPAEFFYNEFHDFYAYNGHHFREIIARYPNSGLADDAAYLMTKLKDTNQECEGWVPCYLHREWQPVREFIIAYPASPLADSALVPVISTFDRLVDPARLDANYETDTTEVRQIVAGVDSVSARLPAPLRSRVSVAVAQWRSWLRAPK